MKNLECSSRGDKRFSALSAKVSVNGVVDTIENHYQLSKRFVMTESKGIIIPKNFKEAKDLQKNESFELKGFVVGNMKCPKRDLTYWYKSLWFKYFLENPELIQEINKFDTFSDMFIATNTVNSQKDVIEFIRYNGLKALGTELKPFFNNIRSKK